METKIITAYQKEKRKYWINKINRLSGNFGSDTEKMETELGEEVAKDGLDALLGHLRLCGAIPERYGRDSSEEKLYSKYTDVVISEAYSALGFNSFVLKERADAADVECVSDAYSFVADAKAFRLSRTAKNQKDFKIQAMDGWKYGKPYAMVVCPVYQLPSRTSQIYQQAGTRSVCIWTYTHLTVLVRYAEERSQSQARNLLLEIFKSVDAMHPSKDAILYWQTLNQKMLGFDNSIRTFWLEEKLATLESIQLSRNEALRFLATERERIFKLSKDEAIREVLKASKIDNKIEKIKSVSDNGLLDAGIKE